MPPNAAALILTLIFKPPLRDAVTLGAALALFHADLDPSSIGQVIMYIPHPVPSRCSTNRGPSQWPASYMGTSTASH